MGRTKTKRGRPKGSKDKTTRNRLKKRQKVAEEDAFENKFQHIPTTTVEDYSRAGLIIDSNGNRN